MPENNDARDAIERELFLRTLNIVAPRGSAVEQLARAMSDASYAEGEAIYQAGEPAGLIYFLTDGAVELTAEGAAPWRIEAPAVVGLLDVLHGRPHARSAVTLAPTRALVLRGEDWFDVLEEHFEVARDAIVRGSESVHELQITSPPAGGFPEIDVVDAAPAPDSTLDLVDRTLALRAVSAFARAGVQVLAILAAFASERALTPGERLFEQDDPAASFFVIVRGVVRITRSEPEIRARLGPGTIIGGTSAIGLAKRGYTAEAESPAVLLGIKRDDLFDVLEDHVEATRSIMAALGGDRERVMEARASRGAPADLPGSTIAAPGS